MEIKLMLQTDMVGYRVPGEPVRAYFCDPIPCWSARQHERGKNRI